MSFIYKEKVYDGVWSFVKNKKERNNVVRLRVKFVQSDYMA